MTRPSRHALALALGAAVATVPVASGAATDAADAPQPHVRSAPRVGSTIATAATSARTAPIAAMATTAVAAPAAANQQVPEASTATCVADLAPTQTLGEQIDARLRKADRSSRHYEIDQLSDMWMALKRRGQLDREVQGEQLLNTALRNMRYSGFRRDKRLRRQVPFEPEVLASIADRSRFMATPEQALSAEQLLSSMREPYQSAVRLSLTGRSWREVAETMGVSHAAVRKWMQRLRDDLASSSHAIVS